MVVYALVFIVAFVSVLFAAIKLIDIESACDNFNIVSFFITILIVAGFGLLCISLILKIYYFSFKE